MRVLFRLAAARVISLAGFIQSLLGLRLDLPGLTRLLGFGRSAGCRSGGGAGQAAAAQQGADQHQESQAGCVQGQRML